jgi:hypothetical protein
MILDLTDLSWKKHFTDEEINEMINFNKKKKLIKLPATVDNYITKLRESNDAISLKTNLTQESQCPASE